MTFSLLLLAAAVLQVLTPGVWTQTSPVVCTHIEPWANNTRGQNPCLVAAFLQSTCSDSTWNVPALADGQFYTGPAVRDANPCMCSTVVYDLLSECGLCQSRAIIPWSQYKTNCSDVLISIATWPNPIPTGTSIPAWAFYNPIPKDVFNEQDASLFAGKPDVTVISSASPTPFPLQSAAAAASSSSSVNIGAIVGGAVGGLVVLALIVGSAIYVLRLLKRRSSKLSPSQQYMKEPIYGLSPTAPPHFGAASGNSSRTTRSGTVRHHHQTSSQEHRSAKPPREHRSTHASRERSSHAPREQRSHNNSSKALPYPPPTGHLPQQSYDPSDPIYPPSSKGSISQHSHTYSHSNSMSPVPASYTPNMSPYGQYDNNYAPRRPPAGY